MTLEIVEAPAVRAVLPELPKYPKMRALALKHEGSKGHSCEYFGGTREVAPGGSPPRSGAKFGYVKFKQSAQAGSR